MVTVDGMGSGSGMCSQPMASGVVATWAFAGATGDQTSTAASSAAPGSVASPVGRSSDLTPFATADSISSKGWPASATIDTTRGYYTFTITPPTGCTTSLSAASVQGRISASGPSTVVIGTSDDGFAQTSTLAVTTSDTTDTPTLSVAAATAPVEVRIFGYSSSPAGTYRLDGTLTLTGSFQ